MDAPERESRERSEEPVNRLERRKMRTRAALIRAAQGFIARNRMDVPVLEITQAADVGMGSFYNHFGSKEELFEAAVTDALDRFGALLDGLTSSTTDPAEAFAARFRLSGRLFRHRPQEAALRRLGDPIDIAGAVLFFIRDATYATGQIIAIDGGRSIGW